jgi:hypothetical protein
MPNDDNGRSEERAAARFGLNAIETAVLPVGRELRGGAATNSSRSSAFRVHGQRARANRRETPPADQSASEPAQLERC